MPMYAYKARPERQERHGLRDADSPKTLRQTLRKDGVLSRASRLSKGGKAAKGRRRRKGLNKEVDLGGLFGGVKKSEIASFTRQMPHCSRAHPAAESLGRSSSKWTTSASRRSCPRSAPRSTKAARSATRSRATRGYSTSCSYRW